MPFPDSESFGYLIEGATIEQLLTVLGEGSEEYTDPQWLQVKSVRRSGGRPILDPPVDEMPVIWLEYIAGEGKGFEIGRSMPARTLEIWNVFSVMKLTPEDMGLGRDETQFKAWASASADTLMRRIGRVLSEFTPQVVCPITDLAPYSQAVTSWAYVGQSTDKYLITFRSAMRWELQTSI